jgi:hypothetical protein
MRSSDENLNPIPIHDGIGNGMGLGLKFELMGLSGTQNFFILNFQMNKILFYLQILSLS